ncbi:hypothetical protein EDB85DRAFT_2142784 [Lactarius pseudohatsudake]|nr:hypothetical protein EDB85DRAFT_2142784 [Lactarius pseudohatsudake]
MPKVPTLTPRAKRAQVLALKKQEDALAAKRLEEEMAASGGHLKKRQALKNAGTYLFCEAEGYSESTVIMARVLLVWKKKDIQDDGPAPSRKRAQSNLDENNTTKKTKGVATKPRPSAIKGNKQKSKYLPPAFESDEEEPPAAAASSVSKTVMPANAIPVKVKGTVLPAKVSRKNKPTEDIEEEDDEEDSESSEEPEPDEEPECQPGEDADDYEDVDPEQREFERPKWKTSVSSSRVPGPANLEDEDDTPGTDGDITFHPPTLAPTDNDTNSLNAPAHHKDNSGDDTEIDKSKTTSIASGRSKLSTRQERAQTAERPNWHKAASATKSKKLFANTSANNSVADNNDSSDDESSIQLPSPMPGQKYPGLKAYPPRVQCVLYRGFSRMQEYAMLVAAFPQSDEIDMAIRTVLRDSARDVKDEEIAGLIKKTAEYGNTLGHLVKQRLGNFRTDIRDAAGYEATLAYGLSAADRDPMDSTVKDLLRGDTFIFNVDKGRVLTNEPYLHPAIVKTVAWFFKDATSVGNRLLNNGSLTSSLPDDPVKSKELEIPAPMLACTVALVRAELVLWKAGPRHKKPKFNADEHVGIYDSHMTIIGTLAASPRKYHCLMASLLKKAIDENKGAKSTNERDVMAVLDLANMAED